MFVRTMADARQKKRDISIALAILLCAGVGGYLAHRFLRSGGDEKIVLLESAPAVSLPHLREQDDVWDLQTRNSPKPDGWFQIDMRDASKPRLAFQIIQRNLTSEQQDLIFLCRNGRMQNQLKITTEQKKQLDAMSAAIDRQPAKKTMNAMLNTFLQWRKPPAGKDPDALEAALLTQLSDATQSLGVPAEAEALDACAKITAILTPDQQKRLATMPAP